MPSNAAAMNTTTRYGWVERGFHWAIALLIVVAVVLSKVAQAMGTDSDADLARTVFFFSFHKTVGVTVLALAIARIVWALSQPRPRALHRGWEAALAAMVHWTLYGALILVPLLGWAGHAASAGYAPIWWPLGQSLPLIPKDPILSDRLFALHSIVVRVLVGALALHVLGTLKHVIVDRDQTFARMWRGTDPGPLTTRAASAGPIAAAVVTALGVFLAAMILAGSERAAGIAGARGTAPAATEKAAPQMARASAPVWVVETGTLSITVTQIGSPVTGSFATWSADITFDPDAGAAPLGRVRVEIDTGSLTLGSVTSQAISADFLAAGQFPTAVYTATIRADGDGYVAQGTLDLRGVQVALDLPFTLSLGGHRATMTGQTRLDRRDFGIGAGYPDEANLGFGVTLDVALTATHGPQGAVTDR